jgi:hypothetical protein
MTTVKDQSEESLRRRRRAVWAWRAGRLLRTPAVTIAMVTVAGTLMGAALTFIHNQYQLELQRQKDDAALAFEREKHKGALEQERKKQDSTIILKLLELAQETLRINLLFLVKGGLLDDPKGMMRLHLEQPSTAPTVSTPQTQSPPALGAPNPSASQVCKEGACPVNPRPGP